MSKIRILCFGFLMNVTGFSSLLGVSSEELKTANQELIAQENQCTDNQELKNESTYGSETICFDSCTTRCCSQYPLFLNLSHIEGKGIGYNTGYTTLGVLFTPAVSATIQPFADVRGHWFDDGKLAANAGGGIRYLSTARQIVVGMNAYYDYRRLHQQDCHQIGAGLEYLSNCFDFRLNGYFPIGKRDMDFGVNRYKYPGNFFYICGERSRTLAGVDAEFGTYLRRRCPCDCFSFYGAIGAYHYSKSTCRKTTPTGARGRLAVLYKDWVSLELIGTYDDVYHGNVQGLISFNFPIWSKTSIQVQNSCANECCMRDLLTQPVYRQEIIVEGKKHCNFEFNWSASENSDCSCGCGGDCSGSENTSFSSRPSGSYISVSDASSSS